MSLEEISFFLLPSLYKEFIRSKNVLVHVSNLFGITFSGDSNSSEEDIVSIDSARVFISCLCHYFYFFSFIPFSTDITSLPALTLLIIIGKSILGGAAFLLVMMSLEHNQISTALPILGLTPAITALAALVIIGETLQSMEWAGIVLMVAGTYVLESQPNQKFLQPFKNVLRSKTYYYIYGALGLFAIPSVFDKILMSGYKVDPLVVLFYQHIVYCVMFSSLLLMRKQSVRTVFQKGTSFIPLILAVALLTIVYRFTQLEATKLAPVTLVLAVKRTSILYA